MGLGQRDECMGHPRFITLGNVPSFPEFREIVWATRHVILGENIDTGFRSPVSIDQSYVHA
jgi:hypothetical protein